MFCLHNNWYIIEQEEFRRNEWNLEFYKYLCKKKIDKQMHDIIINTIDNLSSSVLVLLKKCKYKFIGHNGTCKRQWK